MVYANMFLTVGGMMLHLNMTKNYSMRETDKSRLVICNSHNCYDNIKFTKILPISEKTRLF